MITYFRYFTTYKSTILYDAIVDFKKNMNERELLYEYSKQLQIQINTWETLYNYLCNTNKRIVIKHKNICYWKKSLLYIYIKFITEVSDNLERNGKRGKIIFVFLDKNRKTINRKIQKYENSIFDKNNTCDIQKPQVSNPAIQHNYIKYIDTFVWPTSDYVDVNLLKTSNEQELYNEYYNQLHFPYFGFNWDALYDCLRDLEWIGNNNVIVTHGRVEQWESSMLNTYIEIIVDTCNTWTTWGEPHKITFIFQDEDKDRINRIAQTYLYKKRANTLKQIIDATRIFLLIILKRWPWKK